MSRKKIVILGCENSHAHTFLKIMADHPDLYGGIAVTGVYSDEPEPAAALRGLFGVRVMDRFDEAVGEVDGVIVTARYGGNHYRYAAPYLASGVPMFIDKPITVGTDEAVRLAAEAKASGVRLTGGSSCRFADTIARIREDREGGRFGRTLGGLVRAPISLENAYGGFSFYCQHLIEMVMEAFGRFPWAVRAARSVGTITVLFRYGSFDVTGLYVDGNYRYYAALFGDSGETAGLCDIGQVCFDREFAEFARLLDGGPMPGSYSDFIAPVVVMNGILSALENGEEVVLEYPEV